MARLSSALLDLDAGDALRAAEGATAAASLLDDAGDRFDAAGARVFAGRAYAEAGDVERAAALLGEAAAAYDGFGSIRYRDEAERDLRKLGHRTPRRRQAGTGSGDGLAALSARELEVARLVVERKTNPEIAAELFLSQKTVETHLRNAFRKLDVSTRVELARAVERADRPS